MSLVPLENSINKSPKTIAFGLSLSSLPLLERLKARNHVELIFMSHASAASPEEKAKALKYSTPLDFLKDYWESNNKLIFIGSICAVVRLISPFISSKENDPAVLVLDANSSYVTCLLGGHISGGDQITIELASDLGGQAVLTGDSKVKERIPLDCFGDLWGWKRGGDVEGWRKLMIDQSRERKTIIFQSTGLKLWQGLKSCSNYIFKDKNDDDLSSNNIDLYIGPKVGNTCSWHPPTIWIGIGCERNTNKEIILRAIKDSFSRNGVSTLSIAGFASIDKKIDEVGLLEVTKENDWPIIFYSQSDLAKVNVPNASQVVMDEMGTASVAEAAAILSSGKGGNLIQEKQIFRSNENESGAVTIALAESKIAFSPQKGELHLVGSGPGQVEMLTYDSRFALSKCVIWIGYGSYLNYLESIRGNHQVRIDSQLTFEKDRCREALSLAKQGARVALVSSGDSGIYGMAGLALELWLNQEDDSRPFLQIHPGISSFQMAASKVGAPFMHDFCSISLSDLLTPWETIEERIKCAAKGDFVLAIFNPRSIKRDWQLNKAIEILLQFRKPSTPVAVARQLARSEESIELYNLESLPIDKVDMLTILVIGNSQSIIKNDKFLTPRGYFAH